MSEEKQVNENTNELHKDVKQVINLNTNNDMYYHEFIELLNAMKSFYGLDGGGK